MMWQKLKHEWKTFTLACVTSAIGLWDLIAPSGYDLSVYFPDHYKPYVMPTLGISFLLLRRYVAEPNK